MLTTHFYLVSGPFWAPGGPKRARFGPKCPFWGPRWSSEGPGGPNLILTAPDWSAWAGLMLTTHFDLVWDPFWVPGGPKRAPFGPKCPLALNFHGPFLWDIFCVRNIALSRGVQSIALLIQHCYSPWNHLA